MQGTYDRIVNNLSLLNAKDSSPLSGKAMRNCFSCSYYETLAIIGFFKDLAQSEECLKSIDSKDYTKFKGIIRECLQSTQIEFLK